MTISCNKYQFYGKVAILTIVLFLFGLFIYSRPPMRFDNSTVVELIFSGIICTLLVFLLVLMTLQLIFLPKGVKIDNEDSNLTIEFLFKTSVTVQLNDLSEYSTILIRRPWYEGVLIRLHNGKEYVLSDFNLQDYKPIKKFLEENRVFFIGHAPFNFVFYFLRYFKN